ncbi:unknown [Ruminococcus sp. CAG:382]|nr:unknown [Ruminococcus sp. CAG:382]
MGCSNEVIKAAKAEIAHNAVGMTEMRTDKIVFGLAAAYEHVNAQTAAIQPFHSVYRYAVLEEYLPAVRLYSL